MSTSALVGSGFFAASDSDFDSKLKFLTNIWMQRLAGREVFIVDNTEPPTLKLESFAGLACFEHARILPINVNLGHVGSFLGKDNPKLGGWSLSWILPALVAYSESRDFIYIEQDALCFGDWEESIYGDMRNRNLLAAFGYASPLASCEQSLFFIKHEFILDFIGYYMSIPDGDGKKLPEDKFVEMSNKYSRIGTFSLPCGRNRPVPFDLPSFYSQKWSEDEIAELKKRGMI